MKKTLIVSFVLVIALSSFSFAAISAKAGLAGGAGMIGISSDLRQVKDNLTLVGNLGYGIGSGYNLVNVGVSGKMPLKNNIYGGLGINYSSYSELVKLGVGPTLTDKAGVGVGVTVGMNIREGLVAEAGYDTRLGATAGIGYTIKK